ncbi:MAG: GNAT family N-acetyltransferase [Nanobdellota archaeon]
MKPNILEEIKIEKASVRDSSEILKLLNSSHNLVGYKGEKFSLDEVKDYLKDKFDLTFVAKLNKKIVGVIIATLWKEYCYLYLFVVDKKHRHKGIGNMMMDYLENKAKKEGYVGLFSKEGDIDMIKLIKKRGYIKGDKFIYFHKDLK